MDTFDRGGQRRTIVAPCGWRRVGHPKEINNIFNMHKRYCKTCFNDNTILPEFNKSSGLFNGWDGIRGKDNCKEISTTVFTNGKMIDVITNSTSITQATEIIDMEKEQIKYMSELVDIPTKNKKHKKQKVYKKPNNKDI